MMASKGGVTIVVAGEDLTGQVFAAVQKNLAETQLAAEATSRSFSRIGEQAVPQFAAASAAVRAFEGTLSVRATERFLTGVLGLGPALMTAFPVIGALAFIDVLGQGAKRIGEFTEDISNISAELGAGWLDAAIGKFFGLGDAVRQADAEIEQLAKGLDETRHVSRQLDVQFIELTQGRAAGLRAEKTQLDQNIESQKQLLLIAKQTYETDRGRSMVQRNGKPTNIENDSTVSLEAKAASKIDLEQVRSIEAEINKLQEESRNKALEAQKAEEEENKNKLTKFSAVQKQIDDAQKRADTAGSQLAAAAAQADANRVKAETGMMLDILDNMHSQGITSDIDYYARKQQLQEAAFDAEQSNLQFQQNALQDKLDEVSSKTPKTEKERLAAEAQTAEIQKQILDLDSKLLDFDQKRAKAAEEIAIAQKRAQEAIERPIDMSSIEGTAREQEKSLKDLMITLSQPMPKVIMNPLGQEIQGESEKFAHSVFDPLFDLGNRWDQTWKRIRENMLRDLGQNMESLLFKGLFGDPQGSGGRGWTGIESSSKRHSISGEPGGLLGDLFGMFKKKSSVASNGNLGSGAGTIPTAAASLMQMGNGSSASGGIQVILNNQGAPMQVSQTQQS